MTEYRKNVIELFKKGLPARAIADQLGKPVTAIHSMISECRKDGQLPEIGPEEAASRRRVGHMLAYRQDQKMRENG